MNREPGSLPLNIVDVLDEATTFVKQLEDHDLGDTRVSAAYLDTVYENFRSAATFPQLIFRLVDIVLKYKYQFMTHGYEDRWRALLVRLLGSITFQEDNVHLSENTRLRHETLRTLYYEIGFAHDFEYDHANAERNYHAAVTIAQGIDDETWLLAQAEMLLRLLEYPSYRSAKSDIQDLISKCETAGNEYALTAATLAMAKVHWYFDHVEEAYEYGSQVITLAKRHKQYSYLRAAIVYMFRHALNQDDDNAMARDLISLWDLHTPVILSLPQEAELMALLGPWERKNANYQQAVIYLRRAVSIFEYLGVLRSQIRMQLALGHTYVNIATVEDTSESDASLAFIQARALFALAYAQSAKLNMPEVSIQCQHYRGWCELKAEDYKSAVALLSVALNELFRVSVPAFDDRLLANIQSDLDEAIAKMPI